MFFSKMFWFDFKYISTLVVKKTCSIMCLIVARLARFINGLCVVGVLVAGLDLCLLDLRKNLGRPMRSLTYDHKSFPETAMVTTRAFLSTT